MNQPSKIALFFKKNFPSNREGLEEFSGTFETKTLKKGTILRSDKQAEKELRFLESGYVREYYIKHDREVNIHFYEESEFVTDFNALYLEKSNHKWQECLTDVQIKVMPRTTFFLLLDKYPCSRSIIIALFQKIIQTQDHREFERITLGADELYKSILKKHPNLLKHIPQYHIASYLGIEPETLSRIKKRIS